MTKLAKITAAYQEAMDIDPKFLDVENDDWAEALLEVQDLMNLATVHVAHEMNLLERKMQMQAGDDLLYETLYGYKVALAKKRAEVLDVITALMYSALCLDLCQSAVDRLAPDTSLLVINRAVCRELKLIYKQLNVLQLYRLIEVHFSDNRFQIKVKL